jgi:hypothetical protein
MIMKVLRRSLLRSKSARFLNFSPTAAGPEMRLKTKVRKSARGFVWSARETEESS